MIEVLGSAGFKNTEDLRDQLAGYRQAHTRFLVREDNFIKAAAQADATSAEAKYYAAGILLLAAGRAADVIANDYSKSKDGAAPGVDADHLAKMIDELVTISGKSESEIKGLLDCGQSLDARMKLANYLAEASLQYANAKNIEADIPHIVNSVLSNAMELLMTDQERQLIALASETGFRQYVDRNRRADSTPHLFPS